MQDTETTNEEVATAIQIIEELIEWAEADREHSLESHAEEQAKDDSERIEHLKKAKEHLNNCWK